MTYDPKEGFDHGNEQEFVVTNTVVHNQGDPVCLDLDAGKTVVPTSAARRKFLGWMTGPGGQVTGNSGGTVKVRVNTGRMTKTNVLIVGSGASGVLVDADRGKPVYVTGANAYTVVRPTNGVRCGTLTKIRSAGTSSDGRGDITWEGLSAADEQLDIIQLGSLDFATVADGNNIIGFPMPYAGRVVSFFGVVREANVGAGGTVLLNLELGATDVAGGVLTWSTAEANTRGEVLAATAITGDNEFDEGTLLDVEGASAGGTRTSGKLDIFIKVARRANT